MKKEIVSIEHGGLNSQLKDHLRKKSLARTLSRCAKLILEYLYQELINVAKRIKRISINLFHFIKKKIMIVSLISIAEQVTITGLLALIFYMI